MLEGLLAILADPMMIAALLLAVTAGVFMGAVPGIGGKLAIVLVLPFLLGMDTTVAAVFLLAMHSVIHTGGPIPSILIGVPGSGPDAATVVDGYPMNRNGQAERALGAALGASVVGGAVGVICLAGLVPVAEKLVYFAGPRERFLLMLLGLSLVAALSSNQPLRGIIVCCFGLLVASIGMDPITGTVRFAGAQLFLWEGVNQIGAILAFFAIPEILSLQSDPPAQVGGRLHRTRSETLSGLRDVLRHRWLTLRTAFIGVVASAIPGLGGQAASWIAYGHAVNSSERPESFGTGRVEGVIGPEAANNSKEGGSLITTLFLGIPSSSGMAVLFSALLALGIMPGTLMLSGKTTMIWIFIWALFLANLVSAAVFLGSAGVLTRIVGLSREYLFPAAISLALTGIYLSALNWQTFVVVFFLGALGMFMKLKEWPRAPFALAIILGGPGELAFRQSQDIWGWGFLFDPFSLFIFALIALSLRSGWQRGKASSEIAQPRSATLMGAIAMVFLMGGLASFSYPVAAAALPVAVSVIGLACMTIAWLSERRKRPSPGPETALISAHLMSLSWLGGSVLGVILLGISPGLPVLATGYLLFARGVRRLSAILFGASMALIMELLLVQLSGLALFRGLVLEFLRW